MARRDARTLEQHQLQVPRIFEFEIEIYYLQVASQVPALDAKVGDAWPCTPPVPPEHTLDAEDNDDETSGVDPSWECDKEAEPVQRLWLRVTRLRTSPAPPSSLVPTLNSSKTTIEGRDGIRRTGPKRSGLKEVSVKQWRRIDGLVRTPKWATTATLRHRICDRNRLFFDELGEGMSRMRVSTALIQKDYKLELSIGGFCDASGSTEGGFASRANGGGRDGRSNPGAKVIVVLTSSPEPPPAYALHCRAKLFVVKGTRQGTIHKQQSVQVVLAETHRGQDWRQSVTHGDHVCDRRPLRSSASLSNCPYERPLRKMELRYGSAEEVRTRKFGGKTPALPELRQWGKGRKTTKHQYEFRGIA
ncbi:hypothetical protein BKA70DRAFT_1229759 [Coprinopsis sp. MPI-PUGE-AT-0042]|nr:hypothetical protein BKA70DRAFT_1229759 [Coprinopsis sp. MPI-PUGE-AT-0042]